jgi:uncharacterized membrane protein YjjP (DUF1212 family)
LGQAKQRGTLEQRQAQAVTQARKDAEEAQRRFEVAQGQPTRRSLLPLVLAAAFGPVFAIVQEPQDEGSET